jgi:hypothetical protein
MRPRVEQAFRPASRIDRNGRASDPEVTPPLARMVVEVKQQHVSHKAHDKPERSFNDSFKLRCHEERIPYRASLPTAPQLMFEMPPA